MSKPRSLQVTEIINVLKNLKATIRVPQKFEDRMSAIDILLSNDKTGIVNTVLDFMTHAATVPFKIETQNQTLNKNLSNWQTKILNSDVAIDIPRGLRELSGQYFKERWKSSFLVLNIIWDEVNFGGTNNKYIIPKTMWFADGSAIKVASDSSQLNAKKYFINEKKLTSTDKKSIIIRKPFNSWYEDFPTPYLVKRGVLFNALLKNAIVEKQAEVIQAVIPYLLTMKAGSDRLAELNMLADETQFKNLKDSIIKAREEFHTDKDWGKLIASLNYDVNLEHLMPDLKKIFDENILKSVDKDLLSGLGLVELIGFSKNRQEAILNPQVLVEEIKDAVVDWSNLIEEIMILMLEKNRKKHPKIANNDIHVIPATIKAFMTDDMKTLLRSLYDRGLISKQTTIEDSTDLNFNIELDRRDKEKKDNLEVRLYPPVTQNQEGVVNPELNPQDKEIPDDRKPGTPEADNFNQADLYTELFEEEKKKPKKKYYKNFKSSKKKKEVRQAPFNKIFELPENVKKVLPLSAQLLFLRVWNDSFKQYKNEQRAFQDAWAVVKQQYQKVPNKTKWVKK